MSFRVEHELDNLPTYVVDESNADAYVELSEQIPWEKRLQVAKTIAEMLNS